MLINLRNALMAGKRLPYDAEVEYLEGTGTQYIDTGVLANGEFDFDYMFRMNTLQGNTVGMGARSASQFLTALQINDSLKFVFAYLDTVWSSAGWNVIDIDYRVQLHFHSGSQSATVNDSVLFTDNKVGTESLNLPIYIFKRSNSATETVYGLSGRFYFCKIWQNGTLVRDYIPVRKGTVGYLYDRVSGKLFGNAGTGDFVLGQDVVPLTWVDGYRYLSNGGTEAAAGKSVTDTYIPVVGGHTYTALCGAGGTTNRYCIVYNEYFSQIQNLSESKSNETFSFTATNSAAYMRMTANTDAKDSVYVHDDTDDKYIAKDGKMLVYNA